MVVLSAWKSETTSVPILFHLKETCLTNLESMARLFALVAMWCCMQIGKQCWTSWKSLWNFRLHTGQGLRRPICSSSPNRKGKISIWITLLYWSHTKIFAREILIRKRTTNSSTHQHRKLLFIVHTVQYDKNSFSENSSRTTIYLRKGGFSTTCHCGVIQKFYLRGHCDDIQNIQKGASSH